MNTLLITYAKLYHWYKLPIAYIFRFFFVLGMGIWAFLILEEHLFPGVQLSAISLFLISEVIYHFKLRNTRPTITVDKVTQNNLYNSCTFQTLDAIYFASHTKDILHTLLTKKHVQFIMRKADIQPTEIQLIEIPKNQLIATARELVVRLGGLYITRMDIFAAYLLLTEPQTQLLFKKHLKKEEFEHLLYWARIEFPHEEYPIKTRVVFWGEGLFDNITVGWTPETQKYITDLTYHVLDERPVLLGRKTEYQALIDTLLKPKKNSAMLVGNTGTGKTSLVNALALNSFLGLLPQTLYHQRVYELRVGSLVAGADSTGVLEARLEAIVREVSHAGNIILFVQELQNVVGSATFKLDLSGALLPYLRSGKIRMIATITPSAYKQYIEPIDTFADAFETISLEEPTKAEATQMLLEDANQIEKIHRVVLTFKAILASVDLAKRFMQDRTLPGSAVTLLTSVAASVSGTGKKYVEESDVIAKVEQKTRISIATPGVTETSLLLHLEEKLRERIIGQNEAVDAIAQAIRRLRSGMTSQQRPISFLFLGPTGVGKTETAKALSDVYFGGQDKIIRLDMSEYTTSESVDRLLDSRSGEFIDKVVQHPFSLILLDELEKAHTEILNLFLQVFEDGRLTDTKGKLVSFANTIIIATSNAGSLYIQKQLALGKAIDSAFKEGLLTELEEEHTFKPEFLNRFDAIITFKPLEKEELQRIAQLYLHTFQQDMLRQDISVSFDTSVLSVIASQGFDARFGARPLRRFIQDTIEDLIAKSLLEGKIQRGNTIAITTNDTGNIVIK